MNINANRSNASIHQFVQPVRPTEGAAKGNAGTGSAVGTAAGSFATVLAEKLGETTAVKFSKHAEQRLQERSIVLDDAQRERLDKAVDRVSGKGVRDALVLLDDVAMVVSARNRTVVTAMSQQEMQDNIVTNIDGAVIA